MDELSHEVVYAQTQPKATVGGSNVKEAYLNARDEMKHNAHAVDGPYISNAAMVGPVHH